MTGPAGHPVLDRLAPLLPGIAVRAAEIEQARQLPPDLADALVAAGVFKLCVPRDLAGSEAHPTVLLEAIEAAARADGSVGWNIMIGATSGTTAAYLDPEAAQLIHGSARAVTGGIFAPRGKAVREDDGWLVSGSWQWASGNAQAQWMKAGCIAWEDGKPRMLRDGVRFGNFTVATACRSCGPAACRGCGLPGMCGLTGACHPPLAAGCWGYPYPLAAYKRSIAECNKAAGGTDCVVKVTLKDNCGALAISVEHNASFLVQGRDQVTATAMEQCQATGASDCSIHENICSSNS